MTTVTVRASQTYEVKIGRGLLSALGQEAASLFRGRKAALVTDTNVEPLYLEQAQASLERAGFHVEPFVLIAGEIHKNGRNYLKLLEFLADQKFTRADGLISLGGGVVGDLTGFAAATFLRGVDFIQIPTTLLAAVDASVGGKTAIDLDAGKNLAGAFYQPRAVLCDLDTLDTLPPEVFADGCAEVIKYGMIGDPELLDALEEQDIRQTHAKSGVRDLLEEVVTHCVVMKRDLVEEDEFDLGPRQLLNLGHTVGHGIEACSDYEISHGQAVAMGLSLITQAAVSRGHCPPEILPRLNALLTRYDLPLKCNFSVAALFDRTLSDKKRAGASLNLVVPVQWGRSILIKVPVVELEDWIERGLYQ